MSLRRSAARLGPAALLVAVASLAACGSSSGSDTGGASATVDGDVVAVGDAPVPAAGGGGLAAAVEVAAKAPGQAEDAACTADRQMLESAVDAYEILNGELPADQQDLLDAQMIREPSVRFEIGADGAVVAAPGGPCA